MQVEIEPLLTTEDELVAISLLRGRPCPVPVRTVDLADVRDVRRSLGRGMRSLRMRGLIDIETAVTDEALRPLEQMAQGVMAALVAGVDEAGRVIVTSPIVAAVVPERDDADTAVLVRSDPDGTSALSIVTRREAAEVIITCLGEASEDDRVAVTLRRRPGSACLGFLRANDRTYQKISADDGHVSEIEMANAEAVSEMVASALS